MYCVLFENKTFDKSCYEPLAVATGFYIFTRGTSVVLAVQVSPRLRWKVYKNIGGQINFVFDNNVNFP